MTNDLSELDELIESDVLEALNEKVDDPIKEAEEDILIEDIPLPDEIQTNDVIKNDTEEILIEEIQDETIQDEEIQTQATQEDRSLNAQTVTTSELTSLLTELLKNKTLEITIKIKD